jgi:hypothetical protein
MRLTFSVEPSSLSSKFPVFILVEANGFKFGGGVNAFELIQEALSSKGGPAQVAKEFVTVTTDKGKEGAVISFRLRISAEGPPQPQQEPPPPPTASTSSAGPPSLSKINRDYKKQFKQLLDRVAKLEKKAGPGRKLPVQRRISRLPVQRSRPEMKVVYEGKMAARIEAPFDTSASEKEREDMEGMEEDFNDYDVSEPDDQMEIEVSVSEGAKADIAIGEDVQDESPTLPLWESSDVFVEEESNLDALMSSELDEA